MTGIDELFREYSEPDEFEYQAQLELFAWRRVEAKREHNEANRYHKQAHDRARAARPDRVVYLRDWHRDYRKRKSEDAAWVERQRELTRARLARFRAARRAA